MNKVIIIRIIVKAYFVAALAGSFTHIIAAAEKLGLHGWEAMIVPLLIDGMFLIAIVLRGDVYSARTRRIGLRVQVAMGLLSLTANVTASKSAGGILLAVLLVGGMVFSEWLVDPKQMQTAAQADAEAAAEAAAQAAQAAAEAAAARKAEGIRKSAATRARNARTRKVEVKVLEKMLNV